MNQLVRKTLPEWRMERGDVAAGGWTQQDLAVQAGLYATTISGIETGRTRPSFDTMQAIARALGIGMDQIIWPESRPGAPRRRRRRTSNPLGGNGGQHGQTNGMAEMAEMANDDSDPADGESPKAQARPAA